MRRILVVKMSSLGDVVHTLPAVTDAAGALEGTAIDWVVEEGFAAVPARHPAVAEVIPVAWRRWRRNLPRHRGELRDFVQRLRARHYDRVVDAQGLLKSAAVTAMSRRGEGVGFSRASAREGAAALFYRRGVPVPRGDHAVDRVRRLFAEALDYPLPAGAPQFGIVGDGSGGAPAGSARVCVLLHGTTWESKHWPEVFWCDVATRAARAGFDVVVPWGNDAEHARAEAIAAASPARVLARQALSGLADTLASAALVIGVDSGPAHLAAALAVPTVVVYGSTSSELTGCRGARVRNLQAAFPCAPCLRRRCSYIGPPQRWQGREVTPACFARVPPEQVWQTAMELVNADRVLHL